MPIHFPIYNTVAGLQPKEHPPINEIRQNRCHRMRREIHGSKVFGTGLMKTLVDVLQKHFNRLNLELNVHVEPEQLLLFKDHSISCSTQRNGLGVLPWNVAVEKRLVCMYVDKCVMDWQQLRAFTEQVLKIWRVILLFAAPVELRHRCCFVVEVYATHIGRNMKIEADLLQSGFQRTR